MSGVSLIQLGPFGRSFRLRTVLKVGSKGEKHDVRLMLGTMQSDEKSKKRKGTVHERDKHSKKIRVAECNVKACSRSWAMPLAGATAYKLRSGIRMYWVQRET